MDLRDTINDFVNRGRELCHRLRSPESDTLTAIDLHVLRAQLYLVNNEIVTLQHLQKVQSKEPDASESGVLGANLVPKKHDTP
jgi:hypothetical protein